MAARTPSSDSPLAPSPAVGSAAQPPPPPRAAGRILVDGTERGVPSLTVEAHSVERQGGSRRLASGVTSQDGSFDIVLPRPETSGQGSRRVGWNLQVQVLAPERNGPSRRSRVLFTSAIRRGAVAREEFRIELSARRLAAAGVRVATTAAEMGKVMATRLEADVARSEEIRSVTDAILTTRLKRVTDRRELLRDGVRGRLATEMSAVSAAERASDRFVASAADIETNFRAAVVTDSNELRSEVADASGTRRPKYRRPGRIALTADQRKALLGNGRQPRRLSEDAIERVLGVSLDKPAALFRQSPVLDPCRPRTDAEACLFGEDGDDNGDGNGSVGGEAGDETTEGGNTDGNGNRSGRNVRFSDSAVIAKLMRRQTAPEDPVEFGVDRGDLERPLTAGGVSEVIAGIQFAPGPADVPAFHDFNDVQIAFEPVWQEALDERYLDDVEDAYDRIVESGGTAAEGAVRGFLTAPLPAGRSFWGGFLDTISDLASAVDTEVPADVASAVYIALEEWRALPNSSRSELQILSSRIKGLREDIIETLDPNKIPDIDLFNIAELVRAANTKEAIVLRSQIQLLRSDAERIVAHGRRLLLEREARGPWSPSHDLIERLRRQRSAAYPFRYFAASATTRSVNFGIVVTYRQKWTPVSYQVGELVSTIPLAPDETRSYSRRTVIKTRRLQQEIESNLTARRGESEERSRSETDIVARATAKTNFGLTNEGTMEFGGEAGIGGSAKTTSTFTRDVEKHSESVKKEFREAIIKTAEEYKNERKIEVTTEESFESEVTESGQIRNTNLEIPVTFLFYQLQRRFRVSEKLHRLQAVVFVAQEVPPANAIDAAWLIRHDWILNRVLLDDSFRPALTYVSTSLVSEDVVLRESRDALFRQRRLVEELKEDIADRRVLEGLRYGALQRQIERTAESADSGGGILGGIGDIVGGIGIGGQLLGAGIDLITGGGDEGASQEAQIREGAARDAYDRERREADELASRLMNALSTLEAMQRAYSERLGKHLRELTQVERLATHVAQNIMHYMQAIWAYEPDDQRFLRLRNVPVPVFEKDKTRPHIVVNPDAILVDVGRPLVNARTYGLSVDLGSFRPPTRPQQIVTTPLSEVADINRPLGFVGNYMIFPMSENNPITEFMMDPYVTLAESEYGVSDPDPLGNVTLDEFADYVCCLKEYFETQSSGNTGTTTAPIRNPFEDLKPVLRETLRRLLQRSLRDNDEVIVPTDSLYIEALPGAHSVIERFKHLHRQIDVKAAQENLRATALDNVRRAERILQDDLEDPTIEAKYVFDGNGSATVVPPPGPSGGGAGGGAGGGTPP